MGCYCCPVWGRGSPHLRCLTTFTSSMAFNAPDIWACPWRWYLGGGGFGKACGGTTVKPWTRLWPGKTGWDCIEDWVSASETLVAMGQVKPLRPCGQISSCSLFRRKSKWCWCPWWSQQTWRTCVIVRSPSTCWQTVTSKRHGLVHHITSLRPLWYSREHHPGD